MCEPFEIPQHWTQRRLAVDFGLGAPFCCLLFVRDEDALRQDRVVRWYCYRELYGAGYRDDEQAEMIADAIEGDTFTAKIADPSMFNRQPNGQSTAGVYARAGVSVSRGNNATTRSSLAAAHRDAMCWRHVLMRLEASDSAMLFEEGVG